MSPDASVLLACVSVDVDDEADVSAGVDELAESSELPHAANETTIADAKSKDNAFFFISYFPP